MTNKKLLLGLLVAIGMVFVTAAQGALVVYDFSYQPEAGDPAGPPNDISTSDTPYYIVDGDNSGLNFETNSNIRSGPPIRDLSGHGYDLFHENAFVTNSPPSSSGHPKYVTSKPAFGGSGAQGVAITAGGAPVPATAQFFNTGMFKNGFLIETRIEVEATTLPAVQSTLVALPGIAFAIGQDGSGGGSVQASIEGTFAERVESSTNVLRVGDSRPQWKITLLYDPDRKEDGVNTLFLYINDILEDARNAPGIQFANNQPVPDSNAVRLAVLDNAPGASTRSLVNVAMLDLTIWLPEPASASALGALGLTCLARRRQRR